MIKLISLVYRKKGMSIEDFLRYWRESHGPLVAQSIPFARRYVQNHPLDWPGLSYDADGIVEMWFETEEHARRYLEWRDTAEARDLKEDEDRFQDFRKTRRFMVQEYQFETVGRPWSPGAGLPDGAG
jgi:uncharacterized protein (TIGR02118 family)